MNIPEVFQNNKINLDNNINNKQVKKNINTPINIDAKLKRLFNSTKYIYKLHVTIVKNNETIDTYIIGKTNNNLITLNNELIPIKDIIDIYEKIED